MVHKELSSLWKVGAANLRLGRRRMVHQHPMLRCRRHRVHTCTSTVAGTLLTDLHTHTLTHTHPTHASAGVPPQPHLRPRVRFSATSAVLRARCCGSGHVGCSLSTAKIGPLRRAVVAEHVLHDFFPMPSHGVLGYEPLARLPLPSTLDTSCCVTAGTRMCRSPTQSPRPTAGRRHTTLPVQSARKRRPFSARSWGWQLSRWRMAARWRACGLFACEAASSVMCCKEAASCQWH